MKNDGMVLWILRVLYTTFVEPEPNLKLIRQASDAVIMCSNGPPLWVHVRKHGAKAKTIG